MHCVQVSQEVDCKCGAFIDVCVGDEWSLTRLGVWTVSSRHNGFGDVLEKSICAGEKISEKRGMSKVTKKRARWRRRKRNIYVAENLSMRKESRTYHNCSSSDRTLL